MSVSTFKPLPVSPMDGRRVQRRAQAVLLDRIRHQPAGTPLAPLRELSRDLGVAYGTLRGAVRSLANAGYLVCKPRQGIFVAESPTSLAPRQMQRSAPADPAVRLWPLAGKTIEVLHVPQNDSFVPAMIQAFQRAVTAAGATVRAREITMDMDRRERFQEIHHADLRPSSADAMVAFNLDVPVTPKPGHPLAIVTTRLVNDIRALQGYDMVMVDHAHGAKMAAQWLRDTGCRRPAFLGVATLVDGRRQWNPTSDLRYRAFVEAWGDDVPRIHANAYSVRLGALAVGQFQALAPQPDGLFAASDELAVGFMLGADAQGLPVHDRLQVVGFDGQQRARSLNFGRFATVEVATDQMGTAAADLLATRLADPTLAVRQVSIGCSMLLLGAAMARSSDSN